MEQQAADQAAADLQVAQTNRAQAQIVANDAQAALNNANNSLMNAFNIEMQAWQNKVGADQALADCQAGP